MSGDEKCPGCGGSKPDNQPDCGMSYCIAYAAGRASVMGSAEMAVLRDAAEGFAEEYPDNAAVIRAAIEGLKP